MDFFVIDRKRLITHLQYDIQKSARGVMNWMVDEDNVLNIMLHIQGVNYLYREIISPGEKIGADISTFLHSQRSVLGVKDLSEEKELRIVVPENDSFSDIYKIGFLD